MRGDVIVLLPVHRGGTPLHPAIAQTKSSPLLPSYPGEHEAVQLVPKVVSQPAVNVTFSNCNGKIENE